MRLRAAARLGLAFVALSAVACGNDSPSSPTPATTTTTTTTTTVATTSTSTVLTSSVLTVALAPNCAGVIQTSGVDVFLDGVLVGVATQDRPFVRTVSIGTHTIRARDRDGFLPESTIVITTATFFFGISCA